MKPRKTAYLIHRWLGVVISLQLLAWSLGGMIFSILDIDMVRGSTDARAITHEPLTQDEIGLLPTAIRNAILDLQYDDIASVELTDRGLGATWEVRDSEGRLLLRTDPAGALLGNITPEQASKVALRDFKHDSIVKSVQLIETEPPSEYREGPLPAYRVELEHPKNPHIYISARTGQITARRNDQWRTFDFFWMLHTMDYKGRDNFNHPLLTIASIAAILTALAGLSLFVWRYLPKKRPARQRASSA